MADSPTPEIIVREHLEICSQLHELLLEENRVLRTTGALPSPDLLEKKRSFLPRLDASLEKLREINAAGGRLSREAATAIADGRKRLMQLLMLDRENERLLLKASLPPQVKAAYAPVSPGQIARAYANAKKRA
ncbi:MAG: hypothetical protein ACREIA_06715 [Opitutaceae bacterium]